MIETLLTGTLNLNTNKQNQTINRGFMKAKDCTFDVVRSKVLSSCAVTTHLIYVFVFRICKIRFSRNVAHMQNCKNITLVKIECLQ